MDWLIWCAVFLFIVFCLFGYLRGALVALWVYVGFVFMGLSFCWHFDVGCFVVVGYYGLCLMSWLIVLCWWETLLLLLSFGFRFWSWLFLVASWCYGMSAVRASVVYLCCCALGSFWYVCGWVCIGLVFWFVWGLYNFWSFSWVGIVVGCWFCVCFDFAWGGLG